MAVAYHRYDLRAWKAFVFMDWIVSAPWREGSSVTLLKQEHGYKQFFHGSPKLTVVDARPGSHTLPELNCTIGKSELPQSAVSALRGYDP